MIANPLDILNPVFHFLDGVIQDYGLDFFVVFVHLLIPFTVWALSGELRRKLLGGKPMPNNQPVIRIHFPVGRPAPPPEPIEQFAPLREPPDYEHDDCTLDKPPFTAGNRVIVFSRLPGESSGAWYLAPPFPRLGIASALGLVTGVGRRFQIAPGFGFAAGAVREIFGRACTWS